MKKPIATTCVLFGALLGSPVAVVAQDSDRSHSAAIVKDSSVTTRIKTKLAAEHPAGLERIHVDTDKDGVVWLSGNASSPAMAAKAVSIARATERVRAVESEIKIKSEHSADAAHPPAHPIRQEKPLPAGDRGIEEAVGLALVFGLLGGTGLAHR